MRERLHVTVKPETIDGVRAYVVTPDVIPPEHRDKVLIHVHGGCYVYYPGEAGTAEAIMMAGFGHFKVISVDYRMPPEAYFPGALDDAMTVYKSVLKTSNPKNIAVFGTSAGGALTLEMMLRAKQLGLPMPGAIAPGTPMSDVTKTGDSFYTNELVDNVLVSRDGFCDAATVVYAHGHDLKDPLLSPVYGDMQSLPPEHVTFCSATPCACIASYARPASRLSLRSSKVSRMLNTRPTISPPKPRRRSERSPHTSTSTSASKSGVSDVPAQGRVAIKAFISRSTSASLERKT
jgi:acetyl esterase/lipase